MGKTHKAGVGGWFPYYLWKADCWGKLRGLWVIGWRMALWAVALWLVYICQAFHHVHFFAFFFNISSFHTGIIAVFNGLIYPKEISFTWQSQWITSKYSDVLLCITEKLITLLLGYLQLPANAPGLSSLHQAWNLHKTWSSVSHANKLSWFLIPSLILPRWSDFSYF